MVYRQFQWVTSSWMVARTFRKRRWLRWGRGAGILELFTLRLLVVSLCGWVALPVFSPRDSSGFFRELVRGKSIWKLFSHSFRQIPSTFDDLMLQDIQIGHHAWRRRWSGNLLWGLGGWAWDAGNFTGFFFRPAGTRRLAGCGWRTIIIIHARIYIYIFFLLVGVWRSCQNPQSMAVFWISSWNRCVIGSHGFVARGIGIYRSVRWLVVSSCCVERGRSQALRVCVQLCLLTSYLRDFIFIWLWQLSSHPCHSLGGPRSDCKPSSGIQSLLGFPGWREGAVLCRLSPKGLWETEGCL